MNIDEYMDLDSLNVFDNNVNVNEWEEDASHDDMLKLPDEFLDQKAYRASLEAGLRDKRDWMRDGEEGVHPETIDDLIYENDFDDRG